MDIIKRVQGGSLIADWKRPLHPDADIPGAGLHLNIWLYEGQPAKENSTKEIVFSHVHFTPLQDKQ